MSSSPSEQELLAELQRIKAEKAEKAEQRRLAAQREAEEEAALERRIAETLKKAEEKRLEEERKAEEARKAAEALRLEAERKAAEASKAEEERNREEVIEAARRLAEATRIQFDQEAGERGILEKVYGPVARLPDGLLTMPSEKVGPVSVSFPVFWSYMMDRQHADDVEKKYKGRKTGPKSKAVVEDSGDDGSVKAPTAKITKDGLYEPACALCVKSKKKCQVPMKSEGSLFRGACIPCATAKTGCEHSTRGKDKDKTDPAPPKKKARRGSPKASGSRKRPLVVSSGAEDSDAERASLSGLWSLVGKVSGRTKKIETAVEDLSHPLL
ncbi:hypothetical protein ONZ45_g13656 [Pleurotus djamor]|nr:hypothetical protein ONZ45_g13656 [Pleurotus djamor]